MSEIEENTNVVRNRCDNCFHGATMTTIEGKHMTYCDLHKKWVDSSSECGDHVRGGYDTK